MTLATIMSREFSIAKLYERAVGLIEFAGLCLVIIGIVSAHSTTALVAYAAGAPIAVFVLRELSASYYAAGERLRRLFFLQQGLARNPKPSELLDILATAPSLPSADPRPIGDYFSSTLPPGLPRLAQVLQEAAYYTTRQSQIAARAYYALASIGLLATIALGWYWLQTRAAAVGATPLAQLFSALLLFFGTGSMAARARAFATLAETAHAVFSDASSAWRAQDLDETELYSLLSTYDAALARSAPLPGFIYRLSRNRLNNAWATVMAQGR